MDNQLEMDFSDTEFQSKVKIMRNIIDESRNSSTFYIRYYNKKFYFSEREYVTYSPPEWLDHLILTYTDVINSLRNRRLVKGIRNFNKNILAILLSHYNGEDPFDYLDYSDLRRGKQNYEYYLVDSNKLVDNDYWFLDKRFDGVKK